MSENKGDKSGNNSKYLVENYGDENDFETAESGSEYSDGNISEVEEEWVDAHEISTKEQLSDRKLDDDNQRDQWQEYEEQENENENENEFSERRMNEEADIYELGLSDEEEAENEEFEKSMRYAGKVKDAVNKRKLASCIDQTGDELHLVTEEYMSVQATENSHDPVENQPAKQSRTTTYQQGIKTKQKSNIGGARRFTVYDLVDPDGSGPTADERVARQIQTHEKSGSLNSQRVSQMTSILEDLHAEVSNIDTLPRQELLESLHLYYSHRSARFQPNGHCINRALDGSALVTLGILLEEAVAVFVQREIEPSTATDGGE
ncbi:uncharacterized protein V1516DRAFT_662134 [Lipomyces oligophaga]|uniref:uncharacterized protein n=1 Tax=Lipomyces oligophaga TaxID=45792 RepID=UPI0034D005FA